MFAIVLIVFTAIFIGKPCLCYGLLCKIPTWNAESSLGSFLPSNEGYQCTTRTRDKLPVLKALLACAALMLASNIIFIAVYLISYIWLLSKPIPDPQKQVTTLPPYQPSPMVLPPNEYEYPYLVQSSSIPHYYSTDIEIVPENERPHTPILMRSYRF
jgi:hypothetical protein